MIRVSVNYNLFGLYCVIIVVLKGNVVGVHPVLYCDSGAYWVVALVVESMKADSIKWRYYSECQFDAVENKWYKYTLHGWKFLC